MTLRRYERYKDSGVEWLGAVPAHWDVVRLSRLTTRIASGKTPLGGSETYVQEGVLFLRSQNVYDDGLRLDDVVYIADWVDESMASSRVYADDVLLNITGASIGRTCVVPPDFPRANVNQHVCAIRPIDPEHAGFISWFLKSAQVKGQIDAVQAGAAREGLNFDQIGKLAIPLPPHSDRTAICSFLLRETAKIDTLVAEQKRLIALLTEKRQAVIAQAVTKGLNPSVPMRNSGVQWLGEVPAHWLSTRLKALFQQAKRQGHAGRDVLSVYREYGVILKDSRTDNFNKTPDDLSSYQLVESGDLVVNKMKAWQGSLGVSALTGITSPDYVVFVPLHREVPEYLHLLLRSSPMVGTYLAISNGIRLSQWRLEPEAFLAQTVFLPPPDEQHTICAYLDELTSGMAATSAEAERSITLLTERRTALISAAVTGQIDVRDRPTLDTDLAETRADIAAGRYVVESAAAHVARIQAMASADEQPAPPPAPC